MRSIQIFKVGYFFGRVREWLVVIVDRRRGGSVGWGLGFWAWMRAFPHSLGARVMGVGSDGAGIAGAVA